MGIIITCRSGGSFRGSGDTGNRARGMRLLRGIGFHAASLLVGIVMVLLVVWLLVEFFKLAWQQ